MHFFKPFLQVYTRLPDPEIQEEVSRKKVFFWEIKFSIQVSNRDVRDSLMSEESLRNQEFEIVSKLQIFLMLM